MKKNKHLLSGGSDERNMFVELIQIYNNNNRIKIDWSEYGGFS
jgi:hypothetical protein